MLYIGQMQQAHEPLCWLDVMVDKCFRKVILEINVCILVYYC